MGGTTSSEQQAHDQLVNASDKQGAVQSFIKGIGDKPSFLATLNLKTNSKTVTTILNYLSTSLEQKNYTNIVPIFLVFQRLLRFERFYRDLSKTSSLDPIISALELTNNDDCIEACLKSLELMVKCQVFNRSQPGCGGSSGESNLAPGDPMGRKTSPGETPLAAGVVVQDTIKASNNDPKIHTHESSMKVVLCSTNNNLPFALSKLFTHYIANIPSNQYTEQQHIILQTILRLVRHFMISTIKTSTYPQILSFLREFKVHSDNIITLTVNINPSTRMEATLFLRQLLLHSSREVTKQIQISCLNKGYLLWYVYIALSKKGVHQNAHIDWDVTQHHALYADLIGFLCDGNETITRLLFRMIPKCLHDNARAGQQVIQFPNFSRQLYLSPCTPEQKREFEDTSFAHYFSGNQKHSDWVTVFQEIEETHTTPLIVWTPQDKAELIEMLLNENVDYNLQLELSPASLWDHEGFEIDYSSQSKYLIVNRYYLHLLLPHFESTEPKTEKSSSNVNKNTLSGGIDDDPPVPTEEQQQPQARQIKKIGNRPTAIETADGLFLPTRSKNADPYAISTVDLSNFMSSCFQRAVVEDDVGWKLACLRMMSTLYVHNKRILQETNFMPYLLWLLTPKTHTGSLFDVNEATNNVFSNYSESDSGSEGDEDKDKDKDVSLLEANVNIPLKKSTSTSSTQRLLNSNSNVKDITQSQTDPNAIISKFESNLEREISHSLQSSFNNPRWRDQILKFLNILFDYVGNINKFVAGNGVNTLLYFINNVHRENHSGGLQEIESLVSSLTPQQRDEYSKSPAINMSALLSPHTLHSKHHSIASSSSVAPPPLPTIQPQPPPLQQLQQQQQPPQSQSQKTSDKPPQGFRRSSIPNIDSIDEAGEANSFGKKLSVNVDSEQASPTDSTPRNRLMRNPSDLHAHSPLNNFTGYVVDAPTSAGGIAGVTENGQNNTIVGVSPLGYTSPIANRQLYDPETTPTLALLDPLWYQAAVHNQIQREVSPLKKCDLLINTPQPEGITEVARKSLNLLLKIVTNAPRLRKKIFKPRVLTSLVQILLIDDLKMVNTALKILTILVDANTHVIPNLAKTGVFLFLLFAARREKQFSPEMISFIDKYHTKQNVSYLSRGQSIYSGLLPDPLINLSLQPQGGEYFCAVINQSKTISHRILWDTSHKEILSKTIMLHLAPFIQKLVLCPFSTYTFPFDGLNACKFMIPQLTISYPSISRELFVGNIYVRFFNLETNRLNLSILQSGKCKKISISHSSVFLLSLLRELTQENKYYTTRRLTLLDHFQLLDCVQPKSTSGLHPLKSKDLDHDEPTSPGSPTLTGNKLTPNREQPIIFYTDVDFANVKFPLIQQQQPYQTLWDSQQLQLQPINGRPGSAASNSPPPLALNDIRLYESNENTTFSVPSAQVQPLQTTTSPLYTQIEKDLINDHLLELLQSIAVLTSSLPQEEDVCNFKYPLHLIGLLASTEAPYDVSNRCLTTLSQIFRSLLVIPKSQNAQAFVNNGLLRVLLRVLVVIGQHIITQSGNDQGNPFDLTLEPHHNDNIELFIQYMHIFTTLLLTGRSSHRPGAFYFQFSMLFYDISACQDFFLIIQTILSTSSLNQLSSRQYLLGSTYRLLQSMSIYDQSLANFQLDNLVFLRERLHYHHEMSVEATTVHFESQPEPTSGTKQTLQQALLSIPPVPDLTVTGLYTPHRYILQYGLILDTIRSILTIEDDRELTVFSIGGIISNQTAVPAFLGKTPTKNPQAQNLLNVYPSNKLIFNAGVYLEEVNFEGYDGNSGDNKKNINNPGQAQRQLTRTAKNNRTAGGASPLLNPKALDEVNAKNGVQNEDRFQRGSVLSNNHLSMAQPVLHDLLYQSPLSSSHRDLLTGAKEGNSNENKNNGGKVVVLSQHTPTNSTSNLNAKVLQTSSSEIIPHDAEITTLADAILLQSTQTPFIPCTATFLQHEKSFAMRKEAVVFLTLLLSNTLMTLLNHPSAYSSNTCVHESSSDHQHNHVIVKAPPNEPKLGDKNQGDKTPTLSFLSQNVSLARRASSSSSSSPSPSPSIPNLPLSNSVDNSDTLSNQSSGPSNNNIILKLQYQLKAIDVSHLNITQQLLTPGALFILSKFVSHVRYFLQATTEYFSNTASLTMVNAHCHVPVEYKRFTELIDLTSTSGGELISPTYIWSSTLRQECVNLIQNNTNTFQIYANGSKTPVLAKDTKGNGCSLFSTDFVSVSKQQKLLTGSNNVPKDTPASLNRRSSAPMISLTPLQTATAAPKQLQVPFMSFKPHQELSLTGQWSWANSLLNSHALVPLSSLPLSSTMTQPLNSDQLALLQSNILPFPTTISILTNELIVEGVYVRIWFALSSQGKTNDVLLPKPLSSSHLFNHIAFALYRYALLAPHRLSNHVVNNNNPGQERSSSQSQSRGGDSTPTNAQNQQQIQPQVIGITGDEVHQLDDKLSLDLGYMKKNYDLDNGLHHSTILIDDSVIIDFTTPIQQKLFDLSFLPPDDALINTLEYSACTIRSARNQTVQVFNQNILLLSSCLQKLCCDPACDIKALSAPLTVSPSQMIIGNSHSQQVYQYYGVYRLLSLLACERTPAATINVICTILYILQKDIVLNKDIKPNVSTQYNLKDKRTSDQFTFSAGFDIISNVCQYLIALLVRPYQALPPEQQAQSTATTAPNKPAPTPPGAPNKPAPTVPGSRRDSALASNPFMIRNENTVNISHVKQSFFSLQQRSEQRVHLLLILNVLYNLILSQTLLRRGKALETLYKTGIVSTLLNIILRPTTPQLHPVGKGQSQPDPIVESHWTLSTYIPMKALYSHHNQTIIEHLDESPNVLPTTQLGLIDINANSDLNKINYFPFTNDIDITPGQRITTTTPVHVLSAPLTIPEQYLYNSPQRPTTATAQTTAPGNQLNNSRFKPSIGNAPKDTSSSSQTGAVITNHPFNTANNTYTTAHRLIAAKMLGLLFVHPIASPYFRSALASILSPQFFLTIQSATSNPLRFLSQFYTECISPAFVWNSIARMETTQFIHNEVQNLFYYHVQQNRYFAQYLFLQEKKLELGRSRDSYLLVLRKEGSIDEDQLEDMVAKLEQEAYVGVQKTLSAHYESLYQQRVVDYQHHITYTPTATSPNNTETLTQPIKPSVGGGGSFNSFGASKNHSISNSNTSTASTGNNNNNNNSNNAITNNGLPYLTPEDIVACTTSDAIDSYYGIFSYDHTPTLFQTVATSRDDDDDDDDDDDNTATHFPTTLFQGTLTTHDVGAQTWNSRFSRIYLTHQVYINIDSEMGIGLYLHPFLSLHKQGTPDDNLPLRNQLLFKIELSPSFFANLSTAVVEEMGKVSSLKQYLAEAEQLHQEAIEDGYLNPETGQLKPRQVVAAIRREQFIKLHLQERQRLRELLEQQRKEQERAALEQQKSQSRAGVSRRSSALAVSSNSQSARAASPSQNPHTPITPRGNDGVERDRSTSTTRGENGKEKDSFAKKSTIMEDGDDNDDYNDENSHDVDRSRNDDENTKLQSTTRIPSTSENSAYDRLDDLQYVNALFTDDQFYLQVADNVVTKTHLFDLYHNIPIETTLMTKMLDVVNYFISLPQNSNSSMISDDPTNSNKNTIQKYIGSEDKVSRIAEFILLESENAQLTYKVDEQLFFQHESYTNPQGAIEAGAPGPNPQDFFPPLPNNSPYKTVLSSIPLYPMYDLSTNTNLVVLKSVLTLQSLIATPNVTLFRDSLLAMHKSRISKWLLPVLYLAHDRYEMCDEFGNALPATQPTILYPIVFIIYTLIQQHNDHVDDLLNLGALFYYLNLLFQKSHLPDHLYKAVLYTVCKITQRSKRSRLEVLGFFVCELKELFMNVDCITALPQVLHHNANDSQIDQNIIIAHDDLSFKEIDEVLRETFSPCPQCDRHWDDNHRRTLMSTFKTVLPQLTLRVIAYTPEKGRIYNMSDILDCLRYRPYDLVTKEYIDEDPINIPKAHLQPVPTPTTVTTPIAVIDDDGDGGGDDDQLSPLVQENRRASLPPPPPDVQQLEHSDSEIISPEQVKANLAVVGSN